MEEEKLRKEREEAAKTKARQMLLTELSDDDDDNSDLIPRLSSHDAAPVTSARDEQWEAERSAQEERLRREAAEEMQREMQAAIHNRSVDSNETPHNRSADVTDKQVRRVIPPCYLCVIPVTSVLYFQNAAEPTSFLDEIRDSLKEEKPTKTQPTAV